MPNWVSHLIIQVCAEYHHDLPIVNWRRSHKRHCGYITTSGGERIKTFRNRPKFSSGVSYTKKNRIAITAGTSKKDQKLVLLHELAHLLAPEKEHHGAEFWKIAWKLYQQYGVPLPYARKREFKYRKMAKSVYQQLQIKSLRVS